MAGTIFSRAKGILRDPVGTFREAREDGQSFVAAYIAVLILVNTVLAYAAAAAGFLPAGMDKSALEIPLVVFNIIPAPVLGIIGILIASLWIHLWVYVCGGTKAHIRTFIATAYSSTPAMLFGWIPVIGQVFSLWTLVLLVYGVRECQEMSLQKSILVVVITVTPFIVAAALVLLFPHTFSPGTGPFGSGFLTVHP